MRSHEAIVTEAGPDATLAALFQIKPHQVRDWRLRDSIPPEWWPSFVAANFATLDQLVEYVARKRLGDRHVAQPGA